MSDLTVFWGDTHDNVFQRPECPVTLEENFAYARQHLDFYAPAYYTAQHVDVRAVDGTTHGSSSCVVGFERWKDAQTLRREWRQVEDATRAFDAPGAFVTFPGYEWQGDGTSGDHNVIFREEGGTIATVGTLSELYAALGGQNAVAIPHHTAYQLGARGKDWSVHDDALSPFVEVYSVHGCCETDEEWIGLRQNTKMGPGIAGGTYQDALARGCHVGAICSTDGTGIYPGRHNWGLMACLAPELTRQALWEAFRKRRVYGVTGDRIRLAFHVNDAVMGRCITADGPRTIRVAVTGSDALDRIEVLRDGRVIYTHAHQGTWRVPAPGGRARFKFRIEPGWGPVAQEVGAQPPRQWQGSLTLPDTARFVGAEPCWIGPGHERPVLNGNRARFVLSAPQASGAGSALARFHNANVLEFEARPDDRLDIEIDGLRCAATVAELCHGSRLLWHDRETREVLKTRFGLDPDELQRPTTSHLYAHKVKLHRVIPETGYSASLTFVDDQPLDKETNYRVRVEQRNGQRAWSSPIWVRPPALS